MSQALSVAVDEQSPCTASLRPAANDVLELLIQAVEAVLGRLAARIVAAVRAGVPEYREHESLIPGLERVTAAMLRLFVGSARGRPLSRRSLRVIRDVVACRADDGVAPDALQDALRFGRGIVWQALVEAKAGLRGRPGVQGAFEHLEGALEDFARRLSLEIAEAYRARLAETAGGRAARVSALYRSVLTGECTARLASEPGGGPLVDLSVPLSLHLARPTAEDGDLSGALAALAGLPGAVLVPFPDTAAPHVAVLTAGGCDWSAEGRQAVEGAGLVVLSAGRCHGPEALRRRHLRARVLVPYLARLAGTERVVEFEDLAVYEAVAAMPRETRLDIVDEVLGRVLAKPENRRAPLMATIGAVVEHSASVTRIRAVRGGCKTTIEDHLDAIEALTGQDPRSSRGVVRLAEAYHCLRLEGSPGL